MSHQPEYCCCCGVSTKGRQWGGVDFASCVYCAERFYSEHANTIGVRGIQWQKAETIKTQQVDPWSGRHLAISK